MVTPNRFWIFWPYKNQTFNGLKLWRIRVVNIFWSVIIVLPGNGSWDNSLNVQMNFIYKYYTILILLGNEFLPLMYSVKQIIKIQEIIFNPKKDKNDLVQSEIVWYLFYTAYLLVNKVNVFNIWKTVARSTNEFTMSIHVLHVHSNFLDVHVSIFLCIFTLCWKLHEVLWRMFGA